MRYNASKVRKISISKIVIPSDRRGLQREVVAVLADSMERLGQQYPVTVAFFGGQFHLVAGRHRIEAAKKLNWTKIAAVRVVGKHPRDRKLWQISENLHRAELTALEKSEALDRWRQLVSQPATQVARAAGGTQPADRGLSRSARELAVSREEMRRAEKIAGLPEEVKVAAKAAGLDDNQSALLTIADAASEEEQRRIVEKLAERAPAQKIGKASANTSSAKIKRKPVASVTEQPPTLALSSTTSDLGVPAGLIRLPPDDQAVAESLLATWSAAPVDVQTWVLWRVLIQRSDADRLLAELGEWRASQAA